MYNYHIVYITGDNKPIWMQAEEREENKVFSQDFCNFDNIYWCLCVFAFSSISLQFNDQIYSQFYSFVSVVLIIFSFHFHFTLNEVNLVMNYSFLSEL